MAWCILPAESSVGALSRHSPKSFSSPCPVVKEKAMSTACQHAPHRPGRSSVAQGPARSRRRQIDPTTCERDYQPEELEFMRALEQYKRTSGRMFPTCSEVLEVVRSLGYVRISAGEAS